MYRETISWRRSFNLKQVMSDYGTGEVGSTTKHREICCQKWGFNMIQPFFTWDLMSNLYQEWVKWGSKKCMSSSKTPMYTSSYCHECGNGSFSACLNHGILGPFSPNHPHFFVGLFAWKINNTIWCFFQYILNSKFAITDFGTVQGKNILWMEEILHHLGWLKPYEII